MPTSHVLVALSSVMFTAASGHTLRTIRDRRHHHRPRGRPRAGSSPLAARHHRRSSTTTPARASASSRDDTTHCPEIEALKTKPPWHELRTPEQRVAQLGLELDGRVATNPAGVFYPAVLVGDLAYVSGQVPRNCDGSLIVGQCGKDLTEEEAVEAARVVGLTMLATMRQQFGSLDNVRRIVKVNGFVNGDNAFTRQPAVVNGLANLFIDVFGPAGKSSRSAVGSSGLPLGIPVEAEAIVELKM